MTSRFAAARRPALEEVKPVCSIVRVSFGAAENITQVAGRYQMLTVQRGRVTGSGSTTGLSDGSVGTGQTGRAA